MTNFGDRVELTSPTTGWVHDLKVEVGDTVNVGQTLCDIRTEENEAQIQDSTDQSEVSSEPKAKLEPTRAAQGRGPGLEAVQKDDKLEIAQAEDMSEEVEKAAEKPATPLASPDMMPPPDSTSSSNESLFTSRDLAMDSGGGSRFSGEGAILPSAPTSSSHASSSSDPVPDRRQRAEGSESGRRVVKTSPAVRTLAARLGVDLNDVQGTGDGDRVTKEDIQAAAGGAGPVSGERIASLSGRDRGKQDEVTRVDFGRTRKVMWRAMGSMGDVPHFG